MFFFSSIIFFIANSISNPADERGLWLQYMSEFHKTHSFNKRGDRGFKEAVLQERRSNDENAAEPQMTPGRKGNESCWSFARISWPICIHGCETKAGATLERASRLLCAFITLTFPIEIHLQAS